MLTSRSFDFHALLRLEAVWSSHAGLSVAIGAKEIILLDSDDFAEYFKIKNENIRMIDDTSYKILKILQDRARIPNVEVSRQVGLAPSAVLERIRKLEKQGFIDGYEVRLNPQKFHHSRIAFIRMQIDAAKEKEITTKLQDIAEIQEIHLVTGSDGLLLKIRCADDAALQQLLFTVLKDIPGVLATSTETVLATRKETSRIPLLKPPQ